MISDKGQMSKYQWEPRTQRNHDQECEVRRREYHYVVDMLARERDAFGKKETELAMKLRKAKEATEDCWYYLGPFQYGNGKLPYGRYSGNWAHRLSYEAQKGFIKKGFTIDHLCRNTVCINPNHLEAISQKENNRRGFGVSGINFRKLVCCRGHKFDTINERRRCCTVCKKLNLKLWYSKNRARVLREHRKRYKLKIAQKALEEIK